MSITYRVIVEAGPANYSAFVPDIPGCVSTGTTENETLSNLQEALELHLTGMIEDGNVIPLPTAQNAPLDAGESAHQISVNITTTVTA